MRDYLRAIDVRIIEPRQLFAATPEPVRNLYRDLKSLLDREGPPNAGEWKALGNEALDPATLATRGVRQDSNEYLARQVISELGWGVFHLLQGSTHHANVHLNEALERCIELAGKKACRGPRTGNLVPPSLVEAAETTAKWEVMMAIAKIGCMHAVTAMVSAVNAGTVETEWQR